VSEHLYVLDPGEHEALLHYGGRGWAESPEIYARKLQGELIAAGEPEDDVLEMVKPAFVRLATPAELASYQVAYRAVEQGLQNAPEPDEAA
jgi:hypothetical protein